MRRLLALTLLAMLTTVLVACGEDGAADEAAGPVTLRLVTHDSFAVSDDVLAAFTDETGIEVEIVPAGDAGQVLNQVILTKDDPLGDLMFGVDTSFLGRAEESGAFEPYESPQLANVAETFQQDPEHRLTPVDFGDVCINFDRAALAARGLATPETLDDLTRPEYRDTLVVENPATSSPGLAFLLATVAEYGEDGWRDYWADLRDNGVRVEDGWETAYNEVFSGGGGGGDRPLVVSYASSPPVTVDPEAEPLPDEAPIGAMLASCFRQVEFVGILAGTPHREEAERFVDFMLSPELQGDVALSMYVFPVREGVELPELFTRYAELADDPLGLPPDQISAERDTWIEQWTETVLR